MSTTSRVFCVVLILAGAGLVLPTNPPKRASLLTSPAGNPQMIERLDRLDHGAYALARDGKYLDAQEQYRTVAAGAKALGDLAWAGRCLTAVGSCQFAMFQYRKALDTYLQARTLAESAGDWANLGSLNSNISGLFLQMGDLDAAVHYAEMALLNFNRGAFPGARSRYLSQLAVIRARQNPGAGIGEADRRSHRQLLP